MNIAIFASAFHPSLGGVEELVRQLAHAFKREGHNVIVLTNRWPRDLPSHEEYEGIPLYRLAMRTPTGDLKSQATFRMTQGAIKNEMLEILKKHETQLLHVQCVGPNGHYAREAHRALGLPLVVSLQGELTMDADGTYQRSEWMRQMLRDLLGSARAVTACSGETLREAEAFFGRSFGERSQPVYNGIRLADFQNVAPHQHPKPYILGIGRHVPQKGFDLLLRAFALLVRDETDAPDLILAGDGPERANLETLAQQLGLDGGAHFVGRQERASTVALFQGCAFFVLPSRHEPQGIVNLEAMASGKAVVAANVGGVAEIVLDGRTGLLFPGEDEAALTQAMQRVWRDEDLRARLGQAGRERAQGFDWSRIAAQYLEVYAAANAPVAPP